METISISKINEVYIKVMSPADVAQEICDHFTFLVPGHTFVPAFRKRIWDGKIRLFNVHNRLLYHGLLEHLCKFLYVRNYKVEFEHDFRQRKSVDLTSVVPQYNVPFAIRDYQLNAINHALTQQRALLLSPTASGKSLII